MKKVIQFLFICIVFITCTQTNNEEIYPETDNFNILNIPYKKNKPLKYSQFIDSINYIPLETSDNVLIGNNVFKVIYAKQRYFVFDETKVFVFNKAGRLLFQVGEKGRGPNEMVWPTDFTVDTITNTIEILSKGDRKINKYNLYTGSFTGSIFLKFHADNLCKTDTDKYIFHGKFIKPSSKNIIYNLIIYNSSCDSVIQASIPWPNILKRFEGGNSANSFSKLKNGILFMRMVDNNFYMISKDNNIKVKYRIDYGKYNIPFNETFLSKYKYFSDMINYAYHFSGYFGNSSFLTYLYYINNKRNFVIYDIKHNKSLCGIPKNDIDSGRYFFLVGLYENKIIGTVSPNYLLKHFKKLKKHLGDSKWQIYLSTHPKIETLLKTVKPQDNQILMLCYLKEKFENEK